ncbi:Niemann-Pick C1 protein [Thelohanellus kitauei]|uniref:Niemann-Pick C1 protein n=1 Tax=Thelohanellus kitauei TaxID=669202 RepID=A0A0C2N0V3_THEKT|nr:Niemann-Pick C1 protein [Thelohanellus kitauei]
MEVCRLVVKYVGSKVLNRREFKKFLLDMNEEYDKVLQHCEPIHRSDEAALKLDSIMFPNLSFLFFQLFLVLCQQTCVMRGAIDNTIYYFNNSSQPLDTEGATIFEEYCASMLPLNHTLGAPIKTCCSTPQLKDFRSRIAPLQPLVQGCQSCMHNIYKLSCEIMCSENQSDFARPILDVKNKSVVVGLDFVISHRMIAGIYNSCASVLMPNTNHHIISFFCGTDPRDCGPESMIRGMMKQSEFPLTPIIVNSSKEIKPPFTDVLNTDTYRCNATYPMFSSPISKCSCVNCVDSCILPNISDPIIRYIMNLTVYHFILICVYAAIALAFIAILMYNYYRNRTGSVLYDSLPAELLDTGVQTIEQEPNPLLDYDRASYMNQAKFITVVQRLLMKWGMLVSTKYDFVIYSSAVFALFLTLGVSFHFKITSDPVKLWSPPKSEVVKNKEFFDQHFGPFYRTEQIIVKTPRLKSKKGNFLGLNYTFGPPIKDEIIEEIFRIQQHIFSISVRYPVDDDEDSKTIQLKDICLKPTAPYNNNCALFSVTQYFQNSVVNFRRGVNGSDHWEIHLDHCSFNPLSIEDPLYFASSCLGDFGGPVDPKLVFGGYETNSVEANSLIITYIVENYLKGSRNEPALAWEQELLAYLKNYKHPEIVLSFSAERSIQDEIDRQPKQEIKAVFISYAVMFVYVCITLGKLTTKSFCGFMIKQKVLLGFFGVLMVFLSVSSTIGVFCYLKYELNLIVLEVLPFLILAVGVDNIFLLVDQYSKVTILASTNTPVPAVVGHVLAKVGHGMLVSVVAQACTFSIGAISNIPVVKSFAIFATTAIVINFILQMTFFLAIFALDAMRERAGRLDILLCIVDPDFHDEYQPSLTERTFELFSRFIFARIIKFLLFLCFVGVWFASLYAIPSINLGLDQTKALPTDSYLKPYFADVFAMMKTGPPIYFMVMPDFRYENSSEMNKICSAETCNEYSLTNQINQYSLLPNKSKIATSTFSWVDVYISWLKPSKETPCCYFQTLNGTNNTEFCPSYSRSKEQNCTSCLQPKERITEHHFSQYLPWFLADVPTRTCPFGGKPLFW